MITVVRSEAGGLAFPDFKEGSRLDALVQQIAAALGTMARQPTGSPLERLIGFEGYPEQFALWWDGFTCELGCAASCGVDMEAITDRLLTSGAFTSGQ